MAIKVFLSWQSDTPSVIGHRLIANSIARACEELAEAVIEEADRPELDKDTLGVGSQAEIFKTICRTIDECSVFVADLTYMPSSSRPRKTPNPNVLIEYGWALKSRTIDRIIWLMNTAYGKPDDDALPFDLIHHRRPIAFHLREGASEKEIQTESDRLVGILKESIPQILKDTSDPAHVERLRPPDVSQQVMGMAPLGKQWDQAVGSGKPVVLTAMGAFLSLWLLPKVPLATRRSAQRLWDDANRGQVELLPPYWTHPHGMRAANGIGFYCEDPSAQTDGTVVAAQSCAFLSEVGQIWCLDKRMLSANPQALYVAEIQREVAECVGRCLRVMQRIGGGYPIKWVATLSGIFGRRMSLPHGGILPSGGFECMCDSIQSEGWFRDGTRVVEELRPFFEEIYHACGLTMPPAGSLG